MVPEVIIVALLVGFALKGKFLRLADAPVKYFWLLVIVAAMYEVSRFTNYFSGGNLHTPLFTVARVLGMFGIVVFGYLNRHIIGSKLVIAGMLCNLAAILSNGGYMPVSRHAVASVWGEEVLRGLLKGSFVRHAFMGDHTRLSFLCDIIGANRPPFLIRTIYSVGDVLLSVGVGIAIIVIMRTPPAKKEAANEV